MSSESLPVVVFITSAQCGHCTTMRLDGKLKPSSANKDMQKAINQRYNFDEVFIRKLITGGLGDNKPRCRVLNIHSKQISIDTSKSDAFKEFAEFNINADGSINQSIYRPYIMSPPQLLEVEVLRITSEGRSNVSFEKMISTTWDDFVKYKIPKHIARFCYFYPSLMLFGNDSWNKGLRGEDFNGFVFGGKTLTEPPYGMARGENVVDLNPPDFIETLKNYLTGAVKIPDETRVASTPLLPRSLQPVLSAPLPSVSAPIIAETAIPNRQLWIPTGTCKPLTYKIHQLDPTR